jgi:competence protein ComEC
MRKSSRILLIAMIVATILVALILYAVWREDRRGIMTVSFLDVGQGDAIFIDAPSGRQMLIDGGPGNAVLRKISDVTPWWDRTIDVVLATHPDLDHTSGLADIFARYRVAHVFLPSVEGATQDWAATLALAHAEGAHEFIAERGQVIDLGGGAYVRVLFPDRAVPHLETNVASAIVQLVYGDTTFLLTGDAPDEIEKYLVALDGAALKSDVLKAGHHGSKTSSSAPFLSVVDPSFAIFSRGCDNTYGHPHPDVVARFAALAIPTLDTCEEGTITFVTDGATLLRK